MSWAPWLLFTGPPARCAVLGVRCPGLLGSGSPVCPLGVLGFVYGVLGPLAPVHRCACSVSCVALAVFWAPWLLFTGVLARCAVLGVRCPGPLGSCSPVCLLRVLRCVCGVLGPLDPVHRAARSVCCAGCALSWATRLRFTGVPARCVGSRVRCPGPLGSCSPVCLLGVLCCVSGVLGPLALVHQCARSVCCAGCAVSWATWLLFTGVLARCVALRVRCLGPLDCCSPVCPLVCSVAYAVSWAPWLLFTGVLARCAELVVWCPGPLGSCSPVCTLSVLCCVYGVLCTLAAIHRCAHSVCCVACAVSWTTWLLFTGVLARCAVLGVRCPGPLGSCSPMCPLGVLRCVCGPLGHLAPLHRCARSVCCVACTVSRAPWLLFNGVPARCVWLRVRCPGPLGSCSPVCPLGVLCCAYGVLGPLALVHKCVRSVCCAPCAVSWATLLLFTGVLDRCVLLWVACPGRRCGAHTRASRRRLFVAGTGWVPSGCALVCPDGGCFVAGRGWVPSWRASVHPDGGCSVAGRGWVRCRAPTRPSGRQLVLLGTSFRAVVRCVLCGTRRPLLLGTCPCALFRRDNITVGAGQGDQCWRCTKEAGQVPWPVLRMTAWAFPTATMRTTDARGQWWGPVLRLPKEVQEHEEAQGGVEVWWGEEQEGKRAGVQMGWDTVGGLQKEDEGVTVRFRMTDAGRPEEEAPIVPVGHNCGESAWRIGLTGWGLPGDRVWYLVLVQAYPEQGRAKGDRALCQGVVVTTGLKARTDNKWAVYRGVRELSIED